MFRKLLNQRGLNQRHFWWSEKSQERPQYQVVTPQERLPTLEFDQIPSHIRRPDYVAKPTSEIDQDLAPNMIDPIPILSREEVAKIRRASKLARKMMNLASGLISPGITTDSLNSTIHDEIIRHNAYPSTLYFDNYPKSIATSVNNIAVHGIPDSRPLEDSDIVTVDITVFTEDGFHGDCSETFLVGESVDSLARYLNTVAKECLFAGLSVCGPKVHFQAIGQSIRKHVKRRNLAVIPNIIGHGVGALFHGPPDIYHTLNNYPGLMLPGMVFTIEPCISEGFPHIKLLDDGWSAATKDNSRTAQFEHTVLITDYGIEILTI